MRIVLSSTLNESISRLTAAEQAATKQSVYDFQVNPGNPGLKVHRVDAARDPNFWSARINGDLRLIIHRAGESSVLCYAGHHDDAYRWAERRKLEVHPQTGAAQFVVFDERVEEIVKRVVRTEQEEPPVFARLEPGYLRSLGVPEEHLARVSRVRKGELESLIDVLPEEATERLLEIADGGALPPAPAPVVSGVPDAFRHPDAARRFKVVDSADEVRQALEAGWNRWVVFLHPDQREFAGKTWSGPAKVGGAAGTGKTVVALHRVHRLLQADDEARVLFTTFSRTLSARLEQHIRLLVPEGSPSDRRLTVVNLHRLARDSWTEFQGSAPRIADDRALQGAVDRAVASFPGTGFSPSFLRSEWCSLVDPLDIRTAEAWFATTRAGRGTPLSKKQREVLWPVFEAIRSSLSSAGLITWDQLFNRAAELVAQRPGARFDHVVADEIQDFGLPELRFLRSLVTPGRNDLFLVGDHRQTIYRGRSLLAQAGIDVRGRAPRLKVNYRTTGQIQKYAEAVLEPAAAGAEEEGARQTVAILSGPNPETRGALDEPSEVSGLAEWLGGLVSEGFRPRDIAVFGRTEGVLDRARRALTEIKLEWRDLRDDEVLDEGKVALGTMHRAKGLEFRAVAVVGCQEGVVPLPNALGDSTDPMERAEAMARERQLFYVACTRARERLLVSWGGRKSPFVGEDSRLM